MVLLISVTVALLLTAALWLVWMHTRERRPHGGRVSATPMVFMPHPGSAPMVRPPQPVHPATHAVHASAPDAVAVAGATGVGVAEMGSESPTIALKRRAPRARKTTGDGNAALGTLRMLPGRLVPEDREVLRDDIRFVALDTAGDQRFTLGRGDGPAREHIQLSAPTVSRRHASLLYHDGVWSITNLSETNPVRVNGAELRGEESVALAEGDLVEMGDLLLRFRS